MTVNNLYNKYSIINNILTKPFLHYYGVGYLRKLQPRAQINNSWVNYLEIQMLNQ